MRDGFDVSAGIAAAAGGRAGAWQFIRDFAGSWRSPLAHGDGYGEADIGAAEQRLAVRFPAAVREAYQLLGRRADLTSNQDDLFDPARLHLDGGGQVLVFRRENQCCAQWGVRLDQPGDPDPPVVAEVMEDGRGLGWTPYLDRFSLACVEIVLSESLFTGAGLDDSKPLDDAALTSLERDFTQLALPAYPLWTGPPVIRWFAGPDVILRADGDAWVWVRARTAAALDLARHAMPGGWQPASGPARPGAGRHASTPPLPAKWYAAPAAGRT
jgi:hypothetical protein